MTRTLMIAHFAIALPDTRAGPEAMFVTRRRFKPNFSFTMSNIPTRLLALDPMTRGFGYVIFEEPFNLFQWGFARVKGDKYTGAIAEFEKLLAEFAPNAIVLENTEASGSRRGHRVRELVDALVSLAAERGLPVHTIARTAVVACFSPENQRMTKHAIAEQLAKNFPELRFMLPPARKPWDSEYERMSIFDALAFAVTHVSK